MPKDDTMKHIATFFAAAALAGCASLPGQNEPPHYDYQQQAVIAPGFPIERVDQPAGYSFSGVETNSDVAEYSAWDSGSGQINSHWTAWQSLEGTISVAQAGYLWVDGQTYMKPPQSSQGYEFVNGRKVLHMFDAGRYEVVAGIAPEGAPDCAYATGLAITSRDARRRYVSTLTEGISCDELGNVTPSDRQAQLERTYRVMGLK
ncbi:hypothetical protein [Halomonas koreensis]|uniref:Lipoprotein n=1 Tax=Halomonas koreensis TaxID=245385 RepID=A0ABU1G4N1_9GAMM|nr:hypothetical protein [Halomonas koreensis]MDR5867914.1 hypothetical protein [Halomonas koreensis]